MIAQVLLTLGLFCILLYEWIQSAVARPMKLVLSAVVMLGIYFVWFPDSTTAIAHAVGIGRGADLILYIWISLSFGLILHLHLKLKANLSLLTELARHIAIARPYHLPSDHASGADAVDNGSSDSEFNESGLGPAR